MSNRRMMNSFHFQSLNQTQKGHADVAAEFHFRKPCVDFQNPRITQSAKKITYLGVIFTC